ncbi:MAG: hypothetical protein ABSG11_04520 [Candidatus Korobacteraceae bacterium]
MIAEDTDIVRGVAMSSLGCCIRWARSLACVVILLAVAPAVSLAAQEPGANQSTSKILQETFEFPPPVQWKMGGSAFGEMEISVIGLAWGPADSPQMISKGSEVHGQTTPRFFPDRPYALAVCLRAKLPKPTQPQTIQLSGLARIKNVDGNIEYPSALTASGFAALFVFPAGVNDIPLKGSDTAEQCDFFPVSPEEKEFLFEVIPPMKSPILSFRVAIKDNKFVITNASPSEATQRQFTKNYGGTVGAESGFGWQLGVLGTQLSGFGKHAPTGKTLWLKGKVDSLGNFKMNEYDAENQAESQLTGRFDGKFSQDYREMSGYFSKPDGSSLQPFNFQETDALGYGGEGLGVPPCPTGNVPAGWKTYINEKYRFCVSYPPVYAPIAEPWLEKYTETPDNSRETRKLAQENRYFLLEDTQESGALLSIVVTSDTFDLQDLAKSAPTGVEGPPGPKVFDNQVFYYYGAGGGGVNYADRFFYDLRSRTLIVAFGPPSDNNVTSERTRKVEPQILATFRTF